MADELKPGDSVYVTLEKGGYWKGSVDGIVVRVSEGRVTVASWKWNRARSFVRRNVRRK